MDMVIRWKRTFVPHSVFENVKSFTEAEELITTAVKEFGSPDSISLFEKHKHIASLRTIR